MEKVSGFGKGSNSRVSDHKKYGDNFDRIFGKSKRSEDNKPDDKVSPDSTPKR